MNTIHNDDVREAFLVILGAMVQRNGLNMAEEGAYRATCTNAEGLAKVAAQVLAKYPPSPIDFAGPALAQSLEQDGGL